MAVYAVQVQDHVLVRCGRAGNGEGEVSAAGVIGRVFIQGAPKVGEQEGVVCCFCAVGGPFPVDVEAVETAVFECCER